MRVISNALKIGMRRSFSKGGWNKLWEERTTPWDLGGPTPMLEYFLKNHCKKLQLQEKDIVFVPGCGSGWDLSLFSPLSGKVLGMDISSEAIAEATRNNGQFPNVTCQLGDFFKYPESGEHPKSFKLIYDHTFFCAIKPTQRKEWAKQMENLTEPHGMVLAVIFPMTGADLESGPPFRVTLEDYTSVLGDKFDLSLTEVCPKDKNHPRRNPSNEQIALFIKKE
jgi:methyl halide transferase